MNVTDRKAGTAVLQAVLNALLGSGGNRSGQEGADLRRLVGALSASARDSVESSTFGSPLRACFQAATTAGATFSGMVRVWNAASAIGTDRSAVQRVAQTSIRFALVEMALILSATTFTSRQDAEAAKARINAVFEPAEDFAAGQQAPDVYRALVALHAATVRDLSQRSQQLPRLVTYGFACRMPTLTLSNRIYGEGGRGDELKDENQIVHPLFAPSSGRALAA